MCTFVLTIVELVYQTLFLLKSRFVFIYKDCLKESSKNTCTTAGDFEKGMYKSVTTGAFGTEVSNCLFVCMLFYAKLENVSLTLRHQL